MTISRTRIAIVAGVAALAAAAPRAAEAAEAFYGVAGGSTLVTFHSDAPGAVRTATAITGLQPGETVLGIDVRPATGQLYALGSTGRLYVLSPVSGAARALGDPFSPALAGTSFGFDFNPAVDRIRLVSDGRQNLRLNPDNGAVAAQDNPLEYREGDPGAGSNPQVTAATYSNDGAALLVIDVARDVLASIEPLNSGQMRTVGALGLDLGDPASADVASDGRMWVSGRIAGGSPSLLTADPATGALADAGGQISARYGTVGAIAATGPVADDATPPAFVLGIDRHQQRKRLRRPLAVPVSCNEVCVVRVRLERGDRRLGGGSGTLDGAGRLTVRTKPNRAARRLSRGEGALRVTLRLRVTDAAGNRSTGRRTLVFG